MPFIKDAKTGLPGYVIPDSEAEQEHQGTVVMEEQQPTIRHIDPGPYVEPDVRGDEQQAAIAKATQDRSPDPDFDEIEKRVNAPGTMTQAEEEQYARARALTTACEYGGFQTPEAAVYRASVYAKYIKDGTVPPADGLPPPEMPPSPDQS